MSTHVYRREGGEKKVRNSVYVECERPLMPLPNITLYINTEAMLSKLFLLYLNANSATPAEGLHEAKGIFFMAQSWSFYSLGRHLRKKKIMSDYGFNRVP